MTDEFTTIESEVRAETKVRGSRFIAIAAPAVGRGEADQLLSSVRTEFHDATHHCFAYRLGSEGQDFRYSDAGEPAGTAGKPILVSIDRRGLTNVCVVVARYFGGTKLGVGGLMRAYGEAADRALAAAHVRVRFTTELLDVSFSHAQISNVMHVVSKTGAKIIDTAYDEEVHLQLEIRRSKAGELSSLLVDQTRGNIRLKSSVKSDEGKP